ncbi:MAG: HAD family hydrolase [Simkaniaceae bacterium]|nr:HAD family hydrolase [Simkaniaceae bacterium]
MIIFDLDDTLIKTSEAIVPFKLQKGMLKLFPSDHEFTHQLMRMDMMSSSSAAALEEFSEINELEPAHYLSIHSDLNDSDLEDLDVESYATTQESLKILADSHYVCLISRGDEVFQREKLERSGIDPLLFSEIIFCQNTKQEHYQSLAKKFSTHLEDVIVCGDRVGLDLTPAKELGFTTVQMRRGRGKMSFDYFSDVDYKIIHLVELFDIIEEVKRKNFLRKL